MERRGGRVEADIEGPSARGQVLDEARLVGEGEIDKNGKKKDFQVKKGDRVIFSSYAGTEIKLDGEEYLILSEDDVLGVVEG